MPSQKYFTTFLAFCLLFDRYTAWTKFLTKYPEFDKKRHTKLNMFNMYWHKQPHDNHTILTSSVNAIWKVMNNTVILALSFRGVRDFFYLQLEVSSTRESTLGLTGWSSLHVKASGHPFLAKLGPGGTGSLHFCIGQDCLWDETCPLSCSSLSQRQSCPIQKGGASVLRVSPYRDNSVPYV